ncbi:MAG: NDP-sugar synthase, partial [Muribaculum sp.]|nr:NDP-sugar synthase [Muribaculum sp.]
IDVNKSTMDITAFRDTPWDGVKYISGGIYGLTPVSLKVLDDCIASGQSRMRNYQRALVDAGLKLRAYPFSKIIDVDHAGDIETAREFIAL